MTDPIEGLGRLAAGTTIITSRLPDSRTYFRIDQDGTITMGPDVTWNEAAAMLLAEIERLSGTKPTSATADLSRLRERVASLEAELAAAKLGGSDG